MRLNVHALQSKEARRCSTVLLDYDRLQSNPPAETEALTRTLKTLGVKHLKGNASFVSRVVRQSNSSPPLPLAVGACWAPSCHCHWSNEHQRLL